ncbi:MAG: omptin family outer membrane protease [Treponema sp.]|nr:omptin family outer membrane protease [Treponema sp.]
MFLAKKVRKTAVILIFSCFSILGWSSEQIKWSLSPSFGLINGKIGEYLYSSMNDRLLSYLEFNENTLPYISLGAEISHNNSNFTADVQYKIPAQCGLMTDSDWKIKKGTYIVVDTLVKISEYKFN